MCIRDSIKGAPLGLARLSKRDIKDAQIIGTNPAFERISGLKSGANIKDLIEEKDFENFSKLKIGNQAPIDFSMKNNPQTICEGWLLEDGEKGSALLLIDISDRREMEGRLNQANKMEVIGKIAADMAHELNNILSIILLNTDVLLMRHTVGAVSYTHLDVYKRQVVGVVIGLLQALTQVQEMTLVFVPKILAVFAALLIFLPLMGALLNDFFIELMARIASFGQGG